MIKIPNGFWEYPGILGQRTQKLPKSYKLTAVILLVALKLFPTRYLYCISESLPDKLGIQLFKNLLIF